MFVAGMLGSVCGIAGGTILAPLFLSIGLMPVVSSASNQFLAMLSTISVSYQYYQLGAFNYPFLYILSTLTFFATVIGVVGVNAWVARTGNQGVIVKVLAVVLGIATVSLPLKYIIY